MEIAERPDGGPTVATWELATPEASRVWTAYVEALRTIRHPALEQVLDVSVEDRTGRLVRAADPGVRVDAWASEPNRTVPEKLAVLRAAAAALDSLHAGAGADPGIAHGNVRPDTVLVRPDGSTVLVGCTPWIRESSDSGDTHFLAPELRRGMPGTRAGDAYAFARTVADTLGGTPVVGAADVDELVRALRSHPDTRRRPRLIKEIRDVLAGPPETRPRGLQSWLNAATEGPATDAAPARVLIVDPPPHRDRGRWILSAAAAAVAIAVTFVVTSRSGDAPGKNTVTGHTQGLSITAHWSGAGQCGVPADAAGASARGGIRSFIGDLDTRAIAAGGGRWHAGRVLLTLSAPTAKSVSVTAVDFHIERFGLSSPQWIYRPAATSCADPQRTAYNYALDLDRRRITRLTAAGKPDHAPAGIFIDGGRRTSAAVAVTACTNNFTWWLDITFRRSDGHKGTIRTQDFSTFGTADQTPVYSGPASRPELADPAAISGPDPTCGAG